jgi:6-phosphogluconolactonase
VLPSAEDLAEAAAEQFREAAGEAIGSRGVFRVALSGGSTPRAIHARLAAPPLRDSIAWDRIDFFFGDERCVPPDSDRSNYRMAKETLFEPLGIDPGRVHRMRGEETPKTAAAGYARTLDATGSVPFDLVFLGMGPDGHTASLFPGTRALEAAGAVAANWVPAQKEWRITLTTRRLPRRRRGKGARGDGDIDPRARLSKVSGRARAAEAGFVALATRRGSGRETLARLGSPLSPFGRGGSGVRAGVRARRLRPPACPPWTGR